MRIYPKLALTNNNRMDIFSQVLKVYNVNKMKID